MPSPDTGFTIPKSLTRGDSCQWWTWVWTLLVLVFGDSAKADSRKGFVGKTFFVPTEVRAVSSIEANPDVRHYETHF